MILEGFYLWRISSTAFDGDNGMGHVIAKRAMEHVVKIAKESGVGIVGVTNNSHCGGLSYFVELAARREMIGIAMTHTDKAVVPFGGAESYFGTNPIAFGFPTNKNNPIILDMATSNVALGKILHAMKLVKIFHRVGELIEKEKQQLTRMRLNLYYRLEDLKDMGWQW